MPSPDFMAAVYSGWMAMPGLDLNLHDCLSCKKKVRGNATVSKRSQILGPSSASACTYCTTSNLPTANALSPDIGLRKPSFFRQPALRDT